MKLRDLMTQHSDGSFEPTKPITLNNGQGGTMSFGPGARMSGQVQIFGVPLIQLLDMDVNG